MRLLVTGGAGFIGSHFIEHIFRTYPEAHITNVDALTYAAHPDMPARLSAMAPGRYQFVQADITSSSLAAVFTGAPFDAVVNFAAESHVDRSILDPQAFVKTNVVGTLNLLQLARANGNPRFVHVSTDEVYGTLKPEDPTFTENTNLEPNSPYAASKASADLIALAAFRTYGQPVIITRCSNNYGPYQFPEKLLPLVIANATENKPVPVYGDGKQVRDWIYVADHCRGIEVVLRKGKPGEVYNISGNEERPNIEMVKKVLRLLGKPDSLITYVGDRPGHDRRYGLNATKIRKELGWAPLYTLEKGLASTIDWYVKNAAWWQKVRGQDYQKFYQENYARKFEGATV